ncbi:DUF5131 family protein [Propionivibrio sp.]|uniref:DUF5131 family protein n=1 Tax=Propionivibrio sp. TaxID=2212460 RepID=UPI0039E38F81
MSKSKIEWTDETWNPVTGCTKISAGCKHCYAEREWPRMTKLVPSYAGRAFTDMRCHPERLEQPLLWKRPRRIFVNSMSDLFHEDVPVDFIRAVFEVMARCPQHTFQILTKRAERMQFLLWSEFDWIPLPNVWLGVSVENQEIADARIPLLLETPAAVRWISAEPLLGAIDVERYLEFYIGGSLHDAFGLDWVVVGGESGPSARPMHPDWVRSLRDQCADSEIPFLFKQWGEFCGDLDFRAPFHKWEMIDRSGRTLTEAGSTENMGPITHVARVGKKAAGRLLDGVLHDGYPEVQR